jgi:hypothetical protein
MIWIDPIGRTTLPQPVNAVADWDVAGMTSDLFHFVPKGVRLFCGPFSPGDCGDRGQYNLLRTRSHSVAIFESSSRG